jgi:HAMP domain-containing protein
MTKLDDSAGIPGRGNSHPVKARLVRRTFIIALILLSSGFIAGGAIELGFRYQESVNSIWLLQTEMANRAAFKIHQFMQGIDKTMRTVTQTQRLAESGLTKDFEFALIKLLKTEPAITSVTALDSDGREQYKLSRVQLALPGDLISRSDDEVFLRAKGGVSYFSPVYFVGNSEPYATIATPIERFAGEIVGVLIAEVNLKYSWDVVADIRVGQAGYAYVVSGNGDLIAHPDISLVLGRKNFANLAQVQNALAGETGPFTASANLEGQKVFTAYATIPELGWIVLVERPTSEAYTSLYSSLFRSGVLLLVGLGMAVLASLMIGYRVVRPLQTLREGVARISGGDLGHHIDIKTGDELQMLADEFNEMTAKLRESYAGI